MAHRALVADADPSTRHQLAALLTRYGVEVECVDEGHRVVPRFTARAPAVVICAERVGEESGLVLCQQLRALSRRARLLLLYRLPLSPAQEQELCADVGCDRVLSPPLRLEAVVAALSAWGLLPAEPVEVASPPPPTFEVPGPTPFAVPLAVAQRLTPLPPPPSPRPTVASPLSLLPANVPRYGRLAELPLPRLLYLLYVGAYFGVIDLERQGVRRAIYLWAGVPVRVDSEQLAQSLGVLLQEEGRVSAAQLEQAKARAMAEGSPLGVALVRLGILGERDLLAALRRQTERKLHSTLAWREGTYVARDDTRFATDTVLSEVPPLPVIWRAIRAHYDVGSLLEFFSRLRQQFIVATDLFALQWPTVAELATDVEIGRFLDGQTTFEAALVSMPGRAVELVQTLYALLITDMVRPAAGPGAAVPSQVIAADRASAQPVDYQGILDASEWLARECLRVKSSDPFAVLGVGREATAEAIVAAHDQARRAIEARAAQPGLPAEDRRRASEIAEALERALAAVAEPAERQRLLALPDVAAAGPPEPAVPIAETQEQRRQRFVAEEHYRRGITALPADARGAVVALQEAVRLCPGEATYRVGLARAVLGGGGTPGEDARTRAYILVQEALRLDPANLLANLEAAKLLMGENQAELAGVYLDRVLQRAPDHPVALLLQQQLRESQGC
jgi:CheY-like chemotaxis protein